MKALLPRVLVTRSADDAAPLAARLEAEGFTAVVEPLLRIRFLEGAGPDLSGLQALAFTSANGVRALVHAVSDARDKGLAVFTVGSATAKAARAAGFSDVRSADGDVGALARLIIGACTPAAGAVLHVAGSARAGDLLGALQGAGLDARRAVLYEAVAAETLSEPVRRDIEANGIGAVLIFSPRTAGLFVSLMTDAGLALLARGMCLVALSPAVAEAAAALPWGEVKVAEAPEQEALLAALAQVAERN
jgi:uroporphyrinogen-III synthase